MKKRKAATMRRGDVVCSAERAALRHIVNHSDAVVIDGRTYLLTEVEDEFVDALAIFESDLEDMEDDDPREVAASV